MMTPFLLSISPSQSLTLKSLQSTTKLSYTILSEALVILTAEGQDLLLPTPFPAAPQEKKKSKSSKSKGSKQPQEMVTGWGKNEVGEMVSIKRFLPGASFTLNEKFLNSLKGVSRSVVNVFILCETKSLISRDA